MITGLSGLSNGETILWLNNFLRIWFGKGCWIVPGSFIAFAIVMIILRFYRPIQEKPRAAFPLLSAFFLFLSIEGLISASGSPSAGGKIGFHILNSLNLIVGEKATKIFLGITAAASLELLIRFEKIVRFLFQKIQPAIKRIKSVVFYFKNKKPAQKSSSNTENFGERITELKNFLNNENKPDEKIGRTNCLPPLNLLEPELGFIVDDSNVNNQIEQIETAMKEFGIAVKVIGYNIGPCITQYQIVTNDFSAEDDEEKTEKSVKVSEIARLDRDLAVRMGIYNLIIQAPVPGKSYIGIDIPNPNPMKVRLRPLIESPEFQKNPAPLNIALGRDIQGKPVVFNLEDMPHLLVAGTTNSGKSICLRSMAVCLIMNNSPENLKLVMIDPKRVELARFNGLPHLLGKVEFDYDRSAAVLEWACREMTSRYTLFENHGIRNLNGYNKYAEKNNLSKLPYIVIFIDEMSEIMKNPDKRGETAIDTITSMARATGIHLICATQRPDISVITGKIKNNIPARIAMSVSTAINSRVIMDRQGAEKLLGHGDMYFLNPKNKSKPVRVQGPMLTDEEINHVVDLWKKLAPKAPEDEGKCPWDSIAEEEDAKNQSRDEKKFKDAVRLVCRTRKVSASYLQSNLNISFPTASRLIKMMEDKGVIGPQQTGGKSREVLWSEGDEKFLDENADSDEEE